MGLFKEVKKPVIKGAPAAGAQISPLRPRYVAKTAPCMGTCPNGADIRGWLAAIAQAEAYGRTNEQALEMAWRLIAERNPFPAVCGRICPHPCEDACNRNQKDGPVAINAMEQFIGDFGLNHNLKLRRLAEENFPERIAVIGAGPAGLSCAYQLARRGYGVVVFEAFSAPGGMLRYGIPHYRLPRPILDQEIARILELGVDLHCNTIVGRQITLDQLRAQFPAIFIGIGAQKGRKLDVPGDDSAGLFTGTEFLSHVNSGDEIAVGPKVVVVGGGDTAIDAARVSRRLGAEVTLCYRRTREEMPAIRQEVDGALEEGVHIEFLTAPVEILRAHGKITGLKCMRMVLGEPDASGRPRPLSVPGSEFSIEASTIIAAVSQEPDFSGFAEWIRAGDRIRIDEWGNAGFEGIYAGGDDVGLGLAAIAIAQGRFAAEAIDARLRGGKLEKPQLPAVIKPERVKLSWYKDAARHERSHIPIEERDLHTEVERGLSESEALAEAKRCLSCGMCMDCETCWMYCTPSAFVKLPKGEHYKVKLELCDGCKKCAQECPCGYIEMQ